MMLERTEIVPVEMGFLLRDRATDTSVFLSVPKEADAEYIVHQARNAFAVLIQNAGN